MDAQHTTRGHNQTQLAATVKNIERTNLDDYREYLGADHVTHNRWAVDRRCLRNAGKT